MVSSGPCRVRPGKLPAVPSEWEAKWAWQPIWKQDVNVNWMEMAVAMVRDGLLEHRNENLSFLIVLEIS
jgi:hypothetical protein